MKYFWTIMEMKQGPLIILEILGLVKNQALLDLKKTVPTCLLFIFIISFSITCQSQSNSFIDRLNDSAWSLKDTDPIKCKVIGNQAHALSIETNYLKGTADALSRIGDAHRSLHVYDSAIVFYRKCLIIRRGLSNERSSGFTHINLGQLFELSGLYDSSIFHFEQSLKIFNLLSDQSRTAKSHNGLGYSLLKKGNLDRSLRHLDSSFDIYASSKNNSGMANTLLNKGYLKEIQFQFKSALDIYLQVLPLSLKANDKLNLHKTYNNIGNTYLALNKLDSSLFYYTKAIGFKKDIIQSDNMNVYNNLGYICIRQGKFSEAQKHLNRALNFRLESKNLYAIASTYNNLGNLFYVQGKYKNAASFYELADTYNSKAKNFILSITILRNKRRVEEALGNFKKALSYGSLHMQLQDSLRQMIGKSSGLEARFNYERNLQQIIEKDNIISNERLKNSHLQAKKTRIILVLLILALIFIVAGALFLTYRLKNKAIVAQVQSNLAEKNETITKLMHDMSQESVSNMIEAQDEERNRISRELHDKLGGVLAIVRLHFKSLEKQIGVMNEENTAKFNKASQMLSKACQDVRKISSQMSEGALNNMGLFLAVKQMGNDIQETGLIKFHFEHFGDDLALSKIKEFSIYRIIQELVTNALKHSLCGRINLQIGILKEDILNIIIEDDGIGFDPVKTKNSKPGSGSGLSNVEWRVKDLTGSINIDSSQNHGTTVTIDIPI